MSDWKQWNAGNMRYLSLALARLRHLLRQHAATTDEADGSVDSLPPGERARQVEQVASEMTTAPALVQLGTIFELSAFELDIVMLCAGVELDSGFAALCAAVQDDARAHVTFSLALAVLPDADWSVLAPTGALRYWKLVEVGPGNAVVTSPLRIDERILYFLLGAPSRDERLPPQLGLANSATLSNRSARTAVSMAAGWDTVPGPVLHLHGGDREVRRAILQRTCEMTGIEGQTVSAAAIPTGSADLSTTIRVWNREVRLDEKALLIEWDNVGEPEHATEAALLRVLAEVEGPVAVSSGQQRSLGETPSLFFDAADSDPEWQREQWRAGLSGTGAADMEEEIRKLTAQFDLSGSAIEAACTSQAANDGAGMDAQQRGAQLWQHCRVQARARMDGLAQRVNSHADWDDLVLPDAQTRTLREIDAQVRYRSQVYGQWGFGPKGGRGLGIAALFSGASGTGKSLAAEVLANSLGLDLYRIDLSAVVSKYIGETEKGLRRIFDAAEAGGAVLLFDEADALFGKRSEVKDSHDRHANIEVSYLLQRMEAYRGLAVLTTNLKASLDVAFLRRLRFVVDFPFPTLVERAVIWQRSFPAAAPLDRNVDAHKLARLSMAGGNIRNVALTAAFLAAAEGCSLGMKHLLQAARSESAKLEKPLAESEIREWI